MPSERASTPFLGGDEIFAVRAVPVAAENEDGAEQANGEIPPDNDARMEVASIADLRKILGRYPEREMVYEVRRYAGEDTEPTTVEIRIPPQQVRSLGFWMAMGPVTHIRKDSVAAKAGLREGDTIRAINGLKPGEDLDPLHLPVYFSKLAGQEVTLLVSRSSTNGPDEEELRLIPDDRPGWTETPDLPSSPLTIPSIGAGYRVQPFIARVLPGSEAEGWGVLDAGTRITRVEMVHTSPGQGQPDAYGDAETPVAIELRSDEGEDSATDEAVNFAWAFEQLQRAPGRRLIIHYDNGTESGSKSLKSFEAVDDWYLWIRGFHPGIWVDLREIQQADSIPDAIALGFGRTRKAAVSIYRSLKQMIRRDVDMESLSGPLGIAKIAYRVADRGLIDLLMFLGFLSINLAILNFLPIPILDGGHMVFLIWEGVTRRKPSITVINWAHAAGMLFLLSLFAFVMWIDIFVSDL
ncbi:MAG: site-2 protease family protein, partial [Planctomycetaceae bacterium]